MHNEYGGNLLYRNYVNLGSINSASVRARRGGQFPVSCSAYIDTASEITHPYYIQ